MAEGDHNLGFKSYFNRILSRCDTLHDFDGARAKVADEAMFKKIVREAMDELHDLKKETLKKETRNLFATNDPAAQEVMIQRLDKILNGKSIDLAYNRLENGIDNKNSYELSVIRFMEHYISQTKYMRLPKLILDYDNVFNTNKIDLKSKSIKGDAKPKIKGLGDQVTVQIKFSGDPKRDDEYDAKHPVYPNLLPEMIYDFFRRTDSDDSKEYIKLIVDTTMYDIKYFEFPTSDKDPFKKVETYKLYSSMFDAGRRTNPDEAVIWEPSITLADRSLSDRSPIFQLCKLSFAHAINDKKVSVKAYIDNCSSYETTCVDSCDNNTACVFDIKDVKYPVSVTEIAKKIYTDVIDSKKQIITEDEKKTCLNNKYSEINNKSGLNYDKVNILLDLKRAGDACQIIETSLVNKTLNEDNKSVYETAVFVTIDHLAFMKARMMNIPVIFQKRRTVSNGVHTELWFVKPDNYHYSVVDSRILPNDKANQKQEKTAFQKKVLIIDEKLKVLKDSVFLRVQKGINDSTKHGDVFSLAVRVLNNLQEITSQNNFQDNLLIAYSKSYNLYNRSDSPITTILKNHYVHCELKLYVAGYMKDLSILISRLLIVEQIKNCLQDYQKTHNEKTEFFGFVSSFISNKVKEYRQRFKVKNLPDSDKDLLDEVIDRLNDVQNVYDQKNVEILSDHRIVNILYDYFSKLNDDLTTNGAFDYDKCYEVILKTFRLSNKNDDDRIVKKFFPISSDTRILDLMNTINMRVANRSTSRQENLNILRTKEDLWKYYQTLAEYYDKKEIEVRDSRQSKVLLPNDVRNYDILFDVIRKDSRFDAVENSNEINIINDLKSHLQPYIKHVKLTIGYEKFKTFFGFKGGYTESNFALTKNRKRQRSATVSNHYSQQSDKTKMNVSQEPSVHMSSENNKTENKRMNLLRIDGSSQETTSKKSSKPHTGPSKKRQRRGALSLTHTTKQQRTGTNQSLQSDKANNQFINDRELSQESDETVQRMSVNSENGIRSKESSVNMTTPDFIAKDIEDMVNYLSYVETVRDAKLYFRDEQRAKSITGSFLCDYVFIQRIFAFYHGNNEYSFATSIIDLLDSITRVNIKISGNIVEQIVSLVKHELEKPEDNLVSMKSKSLRTQQGGNPSYIITSLIKQNRKQIPVIVLCAILFLILNIVMISKSQAGQIMNQKSQKLFVVTMNTALLAILLILFTNNNQVYVSCIIIYVIFIGIIFGKKK